MCKRSKANLASSRPEKFTRLLSRVAALERCCITAASQPISWKEWVACIYLQFKKYSRLEPRSRVRRVKGARGYSFQFPPIFEDWQVWVSKAFLVSPGGVLPYMQVRIHTGFHRFTEISQRFHNIFLIRKSFSSCNASSKANETG